MNLNKLQNIFKIGIKKDSLSNRLVTVLFQGKPNPQKAVLYLPYGMLANPPTDIPAGLLSDQANEQSLLSLPFDIENREDLDDGEIGIGIPSSDARIYFRKDGKITFKIGDTEGGDFLARFLELKSGFDELVQNHNDLLAKVNQLFSHSHTVQTPDTINGSTTSIIPVISPEPSSSASIDDAKIDEIEVPEL